MVDCLREVMTMQLLTFVTSRMKPRVDYAAMAVIEGRTISGVVPNRSVASQINRKLATCVRLIDALAGVKLESISGRYKEWR